MNDIPVELRAWTSFERSTLPKLSKADIQQRARELGVSYAEMKKAMAWVETNEVWLNSRYQVNIDRNPVVGDNWPPMIHLSIKRVDRAPVHDWRDLQRIKNELVGTDHEALELYPRESRVVDTANSYHLFVFADPEVTAPFGWTIGGKVNDSRAGAVQRPIEEGAA